MVILAVGSAIVLLGVLPIALRARGLAVFKERTLWIFSGVTVRAA